MSGFAAIKTWDGSSSGLWSAGANWTDGTPPANGDQLRFPGGTVSRRIITNNIANFRPSIILFLGADQLRTTADITVNSSGVLNLNNFTDDIGRLNLVGGTVQSGTGIIQLRGPLTATGISHGLVFDGAQILGNLDLGAANRTITVDDNSFLTGLPIDLSISADITGVFTIIVGPFCRVA